MVIKNFIVNPLCETGKIKNGITRNSQIEVTEILPLPSHLRTIFVSAPSVHVSCDFVTRIRSSPFQDLRGSRSCSNTPSHRDSPILPSMDSPSLFVKNDGSVKNKKT